MKNQVRVLLGVANVTSDKSLVTKGECRTTVICPDLKKRNKKKGNQVKCTEARGMVHALVGGETNQNLNNMEDDIDA
ncbi:hypothetical protein Tco_0054270 [Tanacetum coccineum]